MNETDPIVEEVRRIRDAHAAKFNYDSKAIFRDIKEQEKRSGRKYVSFADDMEVSDHVPHPPGAGPDRSNPIWSSESAYSAAAALLQVVEGEKAKP